MTAFSNLQYNTDLIQTVLFTHLLTFPLVSSFANYCRFG